MPHITQSQYCKAYNASSKTLQSVVRLHSIKPVGRNSFGGLLYDEESLKKAVQEYLDGRRNRQVARLEATRRAKSWEQKKLESERMRQAVLEAQEREIDEDQQTADILMHKQRTEVARAAMAYESAIKCGSRRDLLEAERELVKAMSRVAEQHCAVVVGNVTYWRDGDDELHRQAKAAKVRKLNDVPVVIEPVDYAEAS